MLSKNKKVLEMRSIIRVLIAISFGTFLVISCGELSQKKTSPSGTKIVSTLTGGDVFLGKWRNEKNNWEITITKSDDTIYWARVPARTDVGFMDIGTVYKDGKLMNGKDWVVVTYSDGKIIFNKIVYTKKE
jgi:hypothetical protein